MVSQDRIESGIPNERLGHPGYLAPRGRSIQEGRKGAIDGDSKNI